MISLRARENFNARLKIHLRDFESRPSPNCFATNCTYSMFPYQHVTISHGAYVPLPTVTRHGVTSGSADDVYLLFLLFIIHT